MDIRKLISKFLTQLCEKNYSQANTTLEQVVEAKTKARIKKIASKTSKKEKEAFDFKKGKNPNEKKVAKKGIKKSK
jgi:hypothetical protein